MNSDTFLSSYVSQLLGRRRFNADLIDAAVEFSGQTFFFFAPLLIPLFILGVPIIDTVFMEDEKWTE